MFYLFFSSDLFFRDFNNHVKVNFYGLNKAKLLRIEFIFFMNTIMIDLFVDRFFYIFLSSCFGLKISKLFTVILRNISIFLKYIPKKRISELILELWIFQMQSFSKNLKCIICSYIYSPN